MLLTLLLLALAHPVDETTDHFYSCFHAHVVPPVRGCTSAFSPHGGWRCFSSQPRGTGANGWCTSASLRLSLDSPMKFPACSRLLERAMPRASAPAFDPSHAYVRQPPTPESRGDLQQPRFRDELCPAKAEHSSELAAADRPSTLGARPGTRDPTVAGGDAFLIPMPLSCFVLDGSCSMEQAEGVAAPLPVGARDCFGPPAPL